MRKYVGLLVLVLMVVGLSTAWSATVKGNVFSADSVGLEGIEVILFSHHGGDWGKSNELNIDMVKDIITMLEKGGHEYQTVTDANGHFEFTGVEVGHYFAMAMDSLNGFEIMYSVDGYGPTPIVVANDADVISNIDFYFPTLLTGTISGNVVNENGNPINEGYVSAISSYGWCGFSYTEIENGQYTIDVAISTGMNYWEGDEENNEVYVYAESWGYKGEFYDDAQCWHDATPLTFDENSDNIFTDINFELESLWPIGNATISGTITDEATGEGIPYALIHAILIDDDDNQQNDGWYGYGGFAYADSLGHYTLENLGAANYIIKARAWGYIPEFYDNVADYENATVITLEDDENLTNIDFALSPRETGMVSGKVLDENTGNPIANAEVWLLWSNADSSGCDDWEGEGDKGHGDGYGSWRHATTNENGEYEINAFAGKYIVYAFKFGEADSSSWGGWCNSYEYLPEFYDNADDIFSAININVTSEGVFLDDGTQVESVDFSLVPADQETGNSISGKVTMADGSVITAPCYAIAISSDEEWEKAVLSDEEGNYIIDNLPENDYYILIVSTVGAPTYYQDVQDWNEATAVTANGDITGIDVHIAPIENTYVGMNAASGVITDNHGDKLAGVTVYAYDVAGNIVAHAMTNSDGYYAIDELYPGEYRFVADKVHYDREEEYVNFDNTTSSTEADFVLTSTLVGIDENTINIPAIQLNGNYPNPFNPTTTISYQVNIDTKITLAIYNVNGKLIKTLVDGEVVAGNHYVVWNGINNKGEKVSSGVYFVKMKGNGETLENKMLLLK